MAPFQQVSSKNVCPARDALVYCKCCYVFLFNWGSPLAAAQAAATLPGIHYGSPLAAAQAEATLPGIYYGSPLVPAKAAVLNISAIRYRETLSP